MIIIDGLWVLHGNLVSLMEAFTRAKPGTTPGYKDMRDVDIDLRVGRFSIYQHDGE